MRGFLHLNFLGPNARVDPKKTLSGDSAASAVDPEETFTVCRCNVCFQEKRTLLSLRVTGESGHNRP